MRKKFDEQFKAMVAFEAVKEELTLQELQVWISDLTYIKLPGLGYVYLVAIIDLYSRNVLSWKVSNSMDSLFCEEALKEAIARFGVPALFNTD